ncbi:hypothetical protein NBRC110019_15080 [Neptunitalea chrysea]|uniref:YtkA-like n=1 Tax=Neptunitalea chrysea TaxID=1647581 RepID=A0A9W6B805_9FLAO|nr:hypothetical protein [Neptunitalea chrysea]GLB52468.1 hypothetical protein NBRC110019_15080 [Neptunitalea chrysea]
MKIFNLLLGVVLATVVTSCTLEKTDYEAELSEVATDEYVFEQAFLLTSNGYQISVEVLNGTFYKGYNEIHLFITDENNETVQNATVTFLPIRLDANEDAYSCPHAYEVGYQADNQYYLGYAVFDEVSNTNATWEFYLTVTIANETFTLQHGVTVASQPNLNLNMTSFTGNNGVQYYIALIAPVSPGVSENELIAGIYQYNEPQVPIGNFPDPTQFSFSEVQGATLLLDPRMPEPSMGNHSSPNNEDLTQGSDGLYYGVVNYTMTGNWTLNFIFQNEGGAVIKGTEVPTDFTPGITGEKSELHIDILF